jgi:hypothetical protein
LRKDQNAGSRSDRLYVNAAFSPFRALFCHRSQRFLTP